MKHLIKVILPPFIGFFIFFAAVRYSSLYFTLQIDKMGVGDLSSFMAFYRYTLPLLFIVGVLTQIVVIMPVWNGMERKTVADKVNVIVDLCFICLVFALGISYAIWDPQRGIYNLVKLVGFMTAVQMVYWLVNLLVLYLFEDR
jgi:formate/nitrite transporter FocA (FNT family)